MTNTSNQKKAICDNFYYEKKGNKTVCIQDEVPFDIPDNWSFTRLNQILDVRDGTHDSPQYLENGVPFVTSKCLKENGIDFSQCKYISKSDADSFNKRSFVDDKDILFAMIGTIGNATIVNKNRDFAIKNVALFKNIKRDLLSEEWIKVLLDSFSLEMKEKTSSGLQPFVSLDFLRNYLVPIPPVEEQKRILSLLREVFLKVGIIQSDLNQIEVVCKKIKDKLLELYFGENSSYKSYYQQILLKDVCKLDKGQYTSGKAFPYLEAKVIRGVKEAKIIDSGILIEKGTDVILVDGENSGEVMTALCDGYMGSTFRILKADYSKVTRDYLLLFLLFNKQLFKDNKKGSAIPHLNKKIFNELKIVIPDLTAQQSITKKINNELALLDLIG